MRRWQRAGAAVVTVVTIAVGPAGCGEDEPTAAPKSAAPRALTAEEADQLAITRFNNYDRGTAPFRLQVEDGGSTYVLEGRVDFRGHVGFAAVEVNGTAAPAWLQWTFKEKAVHDASAATLPEAPPTGGWQLGVMTEKSALDVALALLLNLAADRPENPMLLRQNGAEWHGSEEIDGVELDKFTGPGSDSRPSDRITYYVDDDGRLHRVLARVPSSAQPAVITLLPGDAPDIRPIPALRS